MTSLNAHKPMRRTGVRLLAGLSAASLLIASGAFAEDAAKNPLNQPANQPETTAPAAPAKAMAEPDNLAEVQSTLKAETDIIRSLAPIAGNPDSGREVRDIDSDRGKVRVDYSHAIDITVFFEYDSAKLTPEARIQLEPLGRALQSKELAPYHFLLAGHTDGAGDPSYNRRLSMRRAATVRTFLATNFGVDPDRLVIHGWGQSRLKDRAHPFASVNRRVEVALVMPRASRDHDTRHAESEASDIAPYGQTPDIALELPPQRRRLVIDPSSGEARIRRERDQAFLGAPVAGAPCGPGALFDPRILLSPYALDDFGATPTPTCAPPRLAFGTANGGLAPADPELTK